MILFTDGRRDYVLYNDTVIGPNSGFVIRLNSVIKEHLEEYPTISPDQDSLEFKVWEEVLAPEFTFKERHFPEPEPQARGEVPGEEVSIH